MGQIFNVYCDESCHLVTALYVDGDTSRKKLRMKYNKRRI